MLSWLGSVKATASPSFLILNKHGRLVTHFSFRQIELQHFIPILSFAKQTALPAEHCVPPQALPQLLLLPPQQGPFQWAAKGNGSRAGSLHSKFSKNTPNVQLSSDPQDPDKDTRPAWTHCPLLPLPTPSPQPIPIPGNGNWKRL